MVLKRYIQNEPNGRRAHPISSMVNVLILIPFLFFVVPPSVGFFWESTTRQLSQSPKPMEYSVDTIFARSSVERQWYLCWYFYLCIFCVLSSWWWSFVVCSQWKLKKRPDFTFWDTFCVLFSFSVFVPIFCLCPHGHRNIRLARFLSEVKWRGNYEEFAVKTFIPAKFGLWGGKRGGIWYPSSS